MRLDLTIKYETSKTHTLENVLFDSGNATLKHKSFKTLDDLAEVLMRKKTMVIEIAGHTDNVGSSSDNLKLSQERANSVKNYLVEKGISSSRIKAKGYGDTEPVTDNSDDKSKTENRRTEVRILKE